MFVSYQPRCQFLNVFCGYVVEFVVSQCSLCSPSPITASFHAVCLGVSARSSGVGMGCSLLPRFRHGTLELGPINTSGASRCRRLIEGTVAVQVMLPVVFPRKIAYLI